VGVMGGRFWLLGGYAWEWPTLYLGDYGNLEICIFDPSYVCIKHASGARLVCTSAIVYRIKCG
jgi:hypothetical protein